MTGSDWAWVEWIALPLVLFILFVFFRRSIGQPLRAAILGIYVLSAASFFWSAIRLAGRDRWVWAAVCVVVAAGIVAAARVGFRRWWGFPEAGRKTGAMR